MKVFITGSSSGIGLGLAQEFVKRGDEVWGISRRKVDSLADVPNYHHLSLDLCEYEKMRETLPAFINTQKHFDLVILNAGVLGKIKWMNEVEVASMKKTMEINVWANKVLLDLLFEHTESITQVVGMSSKASLRSSPGWGSYSLSKAGLNMLMNIYANEYPDTHCTAFAPGLVDSAIQETIWHIRETDKYPTIKKLQEARHTDAMPDPQQAAPMLIEGMKRALQHESGGFFDVREH